MENKQFRIENGYELVEENYSDGEALFVIGDLHLNHENIIRYCNRPFDNISDMNRTLIKNWNLTVKKSDYVFFLGDMAMGNSDRIIEKLNGNIFFVKGNHDRTRDRNSMHDILMYTYQGVEIMFIHNPDQAPKDYKGWIIHGHHHNNHPSDYPFYNPDTKMFNVSVENIKYQPLNLNAIVDLINNPKEMVVAL